MEVPEIRQQLLDAMVELEKRFPNMGVLMLVWPFDRPTLMPPCLASNGHKEEVEAELAAALMCMKQLPEPEQGTLQ